MMTHNPVRARTAPHGSLGNAWAVENSPRENGSERTGHSAQMINPPSSPILSAEFHFEANGVSQAHGNKDGEVKAGTGRELWRVQCDCDLGATKREKRRHAEDGKKEPPMCLDSSSKPALAQGASLASLGSSFKARKYGRGSKFSGQPALWMYLHPTDMAFNILGFVQRCDVVVLLPYCQSHRSLIVKPLLELVTPLNHPRYNPRIGQQVLLRRQ